MMVLMVVLLGFDVCDSASTSWIGPGGKPALPGLVMPVSLAELKYRAASDSIACRYERALKTHTQSHGFTWAGTAYGPAYSPSR